MVLIVNLNRHPGFSFPLSFCFLVVCVLSCASLCESTRSHCSLDLSAAWVIPDQICFTSLLFCTHSDPAHGMQLNASYLSSLWLSHSVFVCFLYLFFFLLVLILCKRNSCSKQFLNRLWDCIIELGRPFGPPCRASTAIPFQPFRTANVGLDVILTRMLG